MSLLPPAERLPVCPADDLEESEGARVRRLFPTLSLRHLNPFVVLDEFRVQAPAGFPRQPRRGFEAVTYMLEGELSHRDSLGHDQVVRAGDVQRFTAGTGILHSELPGTNALCHGVRLWVNLPQRSADIAPTYAYAAARELAQTSDRGVQVTTLIGEGSPLRPTIPMTFLDVRMVAQSTWRASIPTGWNGFVYVLSGELRVGDDVLSPGEAALPIPGPVELAAVSDTRALVVAGEPHHHPASYDC